MPAATELTVLLTSHTDSAHNRALIQALAGFDRPGIECIYLDTGISSGLTENELEKLSGAASEKALFRQITCRPGTGRAGALNLGLEEAKGELIWAPRRVDRLSDVVLVDCLRRMKSEPGGCWTLDRSLPGSPEAWLEELGNGSLPYDERIVFNQNALQPSPLCFNEGLDRFTAAELAYRIWKVKSCSSLDAFFIVDKSLPPSPPAHVVQEFLFAMLRAETNESERRKLLSVLGRLDLSGYGDGESGDRLEQIRQLAGEDPRSALEQIDELLRNRPGDQETIKLKVQLLEKLRRHVEAAELKHDLQKKGGNFAAQTGGSEQKALFEIPEPAEGGGSHDGQGITESPGNGTETPVDGQSQKRERSRPKGDGRLCVIIPTAGAGKNVLQECLLRLDSICTPDQVDLIVIDNASIDDTFSYLEQLRERNFLNLQVITNSQNTGFGHSVNQALDQTGSEYRLVMHNDLLPGDGAIEALRAVLESRPDVAAVGPLLDRCDIEEQLDSHYASGEREFIPLERIDSCCMMMRNIDGVRFNEAFGLAWYEDADLCMQLADRGFRVGVATAATANHYHRVTTDAMGLTLEPESRWENADIFNARWHRSPDLTFPPEEGELGDILEKIPMPVNPLNPPVYWIDQIELFFNDERKTALLQKTLTERELLLLLRVLLTADKRELLRQIESKIEKTNVEIPESLLRSLIRYYYRNNIYSRCCLYLERKECKGPFYDLYRLRIAVADKETPQAVELLNTLMETFPCHPELYRLAGEIHRMAGDATEADSFFKIAGQLRPESDLEEEAFEIKY